MIVNIENDSCWLLRTRDVYIVKIEWVDTYMLTYSCIDMPSELEHYGTLFDDVGRQDRKCE